MSARKRAAAGTRDKDAQLGIRIEQDAIDRLDAVASRLRDVSKSSVVRAAILLGLEAIERDPSLVVLAPAPSKPRSRGK